MRDEILDDWIKKYGDFSGTVGTWGYMPSITDDPRGLSALKEEIERRGWLWNAYSVPGAYGKGKNGYMFVVEAQEDVYEDGFVYPVARRRLLGSVIAKTENLAAAGAFYHAVSLVESDESTG